MKHNRRLTTSILTLLLLGTAGTAGAAPLAAVHLSVTGLELALQGATTGSFTLTVGGPDDYFTRHDFASGETPFFRPIDSGGKALAAGLYTWTLTENRAAGERDREDSTRYRARTQSGSFTIRADGSIVDPGLSESFYKDNVVDDDLLVDGSTCIGVDCTNTESYGFDILRFKENNNRIDFNDNSTVGNYPTNEWKLVANDSDNGGGEYFAIEDAAASKNVFTVEAGAPSNGLYVDADGYVGLGTANPVLHAHILEGNSPSLRLQQDGSDGFTQQTWDIAGNEVNFFIRDVDNASALPFKIKPGAGKNSLFIGTGGIGIGTRSPAANLDIKAEGPAMRFNNTGSTSGVWDWFVNANTDRLNLSDDPDRTRIPIKMDAAHHELLQVGVVASDQVTINGDLIATSTSTTPDYVFEPDFELETIDEHAAFMWREKHLPAVPAARVDAEGKGVVNLVARSQGMLEELEKGHIYVEQLHHRLAAKEGELARLATVFDRLSRLERALATK